VGEIKHESTQATFETFYRQHYRLLMKIAIYLGATKEDAEDAVGETMTEVFQRWVEIDKPLPYARRAVVSHFLKSKERGLRRVRRRLAERGEAVQEGREDAGLTIWEDKQWVTQLLDSLPPAQRNVMAFIIDEFSASEVATLLGKNPPTIRQNLAAARQHLRNALQQERAAELRTVEVSRVLREEA